MVTNDELVSFLKRKHVRAGFIDKLKIVYRPLICPFADLLERVRKDDKVCDIGCGSGQFCLLVSEFTPAVSIYGIEIEQRLVDNARQLFINDTKGDRFFETYNGIDFPARIGEADLVFLIDVLHHVPRKSQQTFLRNLGLRMKSGARLIVKDINGRSPLVVFNKLHDMLFARQIGNEWSAEKTSDVLSKNGFDIISTEKRSTYVYPHYTIVAQK